MEIAGLDIVIRLYDTSGLPRLDHCLFSLMGQALSIPTLDAKAFGPLRLHLMLRRFSFLEVRAVRAATQALRPLNNTVILTVHNWELPDPFDLRLPLLNWGLEVTKGRYFSCLGIDELVLPGAYYKLLARLQSTQAVLALGGMITQPVHWWGDVVLPLTPFVPKLKPLHGRAFDGEAPVIFLLDRKRLPLQALVFKNGLPDREVVEFVQRVHANHLVNTEHLGDVLGVHQISS